METTKKSVFETLQAINCNGHTEQKNGLTYLSWAWAWQMVKANYPTAFYTIYENEEGIPYYTDGRTAWVKTGVTIEGLEHIEYLPIMDFRNNSIPVDQVTSMDMNKAIQRSLTKAAARHGLGLYIYAGEDLPFSEEDAQSAPAPASQPKTKKAAPTKKAKPKPQEPTKMTPEAYYKTVASAALGKKTNDGLSIRDWYVQTIHPTDNMLLDFDDAVMDYKKANNIL